MQKNFTTEIKKFQNHSLWGLHIEVPNEIANEFLSSNGKRVLCNINGIETMHSAIMPHGQGYFFIMLNKAFCKKHVLQIGALVEVILEEDNSEYGMDIPEMLVEVFSQDDEAFCIFKQLSAGKQRTLIHLVAKVKNEESQMKKSLAIAHHLREVNTHLDFKRLNETIKYYNNLEL
ncbi:MAG: DUF1905 domain-containing protein [Cytophagales bacterium]